MTTFSFTVTVECDTIDEARTVMAERIDPDEDYGFVYTIDWFWPAGGSPVLTPIVTPVVMPREGIDRCGCGSKYWDGDRCHSCGDQFFPLAWTERG
jgi:hypothetical protein